MKTELEIKNGEVILEGSPENIRKITEILIKEDLLEPEYRFNGGKGALLCSICKVILRTGMNSDKCEALICEESCFEE